MGVFEFRDLGVCGILWFRGFRASGVEGGMVQGFDSGFRVWVKGFEVWGFTASGFRV